MNHLIKRFQCTIIDHIDVPILQVPQLYIHSWECILWLKVTTIVKRRMKKSSFSVAIIILKELTGEFYTYL